MKRLSKRAGREARAKLRDSREDMYVTVVQHLLNSFGGRQSMTEYELRTRIALWASPEFLEAYSEWKMRISPYAGEGRAEIRSQDKRYIQESLSKVVGLARRDLGVEAGASPLPSVESLAGTLFDDYAVGDNERLDP